MLYLLNLVGLVEVEGEWEEGVVVMGHGFRG